MFEEDSQQQQQKTKNPERNRTIKITQDEEDGGGGRRGGGRGKRRTCKGVYLMSLCPLREPVWPSGKALDCKQKGLSSIPLRLSLFLRKVVVCGHRLVNLSLTINQTLKWLSLLPILMQESFWW